MIINRDSVKELTTKFSEPTWLADSRLEAWEAYLQTPMPTARDEDWRRTDLGLLDLTKLQAAQFELRDVEWKGGNSSWFESAAKHLGSLSGTLFQSIGGTKVELSEEAKKQGVIFCDIATAVDKHADKLRSLLLGSVGTGKSAGKFALMTRALFNCGAYIYVPRNIELKEPLLCGIEFGGEQSVAAFPRVLVVVEDNARLDFVFAASSRRRNDGSTAELNLMSSLFEFHIGTGAKLNFLEVQDLVEDVFYVEHISSNVAKDANFNSLTVALGARQTKSDIATFLKAAGAQSVVLGAVLGSDNEKFSYNTIQEHNAPDTKSDINFRVAVKDNSSSVYQGIIRVDKVAQRTAAYQSNKNLLLSGDAKADSIPKLEILADDVQCSHGATVGPVDREQLFYLNSRGLTPTEAEELIVLGFLNQVLEQFPLPTSLGWLTEIISRKVYRSA